MKEVLQAFGLSDESKVTAIKQGLINTTFRATDDEQDVLMQKINHHVFTNPLALQQNYLTIYSHLIGKQDGFKLPELIKTTNNQPLFQDVESKYWRAFSFVSNGFTYESVTDTSQAFIVAECYGTLSAQLFDLPFSSIEPTIPKFHDLSFRFEQFEDALRSADEEIKSSASQEIDAILHYSFINDFYRNILLKPLLFKQYILHHDCKISNILFDKESKQIICPIDLDTTMPGYFFSDLGDMIRSVGNNLAEDSTALGQMKIEVEIIEALTEGYSSAMSNFFTPEENKWLLFAGHILTYMQALRFLTDYLNGNIYYQTNYLLHNLDRAKNQLRYLQLLMEWKSWPHN
jgi:Ser/Thr protein kinase RdoA (MazF antagonist)